MNQYKLYSLLCGLFIAFLLTSNILSAAKIIDLGYSIFGIPLIFDAGTMVFPFCYILGDIFTEIYGYRQTKKIIWIGFFSSTILVFCVFFTSLLPAETIWQKEVGNLAYQKILGGIANGGIFIASLIAYLVGEFSNSIIMSKIKVLTKGKMLWVRTMSSTLIGQFLDSFLFIFIACLFNIFPFELAFSLIFTIFLFKVAIEFLFTPVTYIIIFILKKIEKTDNYDYNISYNPF